MVLVAYRPCLLLTDNSGWQAEARIAAARGFNQRSTIHRLKAVADLEDGNGPDMLGRREQRSGSD